MSLRNKNNSDSNWMSFSDVMTGLMVIFLFIAISYMMQVNKTAKKNKEIVDNFYQNKELLYKRLKHEFQEDFDDWDVELDEDLSIKFTNPDILFKSGSSNLRVEFKGILNNFLPRYFNIIIEPQFIDKISEVRIEGHTDNEPIWALDLDSYIGNIKLSQQRSAQVLKYFRQTSYFRKLSNKSKYRFEYLLTANGLSYGRTLDKYKELTFISKRSIDKVLSRRVEFKIVTKSEDVLKSLKRNM
jgi:outer membrane protein OmpA-like peptidoglycan-associated protein